MSNKVSPKSIVKLFVITLIVLTVSVVIFAEPKYWPSGVPGTSQVYGTTFDTVDANWRFKSYNHRINNFWLVKDNIVSRSWYKTIQPQDFICYDEDKEKCVLQGSTYCSGPGRDIFVDEAPWYQFGTRYVTTKHKYEIQPFPPEVFYTSSGGTRSTSNDFKGNGAISNTPCP